MNVAVWFPAVRSWFGRTPFYSKQPRRSQSCNPSATFSHPQPETCPRSPAHLGVPPSPLARQGCGYRPRIALMGFLSDEVRPMAERCGRQCQKASRRIFSTAMLMQQQQHRIEVAVLPRLKLDSTCNRSEAYQPFGVAAELTTTAYLGLGGIFNPQRTNHIGNIRRFCTDPNGRQSVALTRLRLQWPDREES